MRLFLVLLFCFLGHPSAFADRKLGIVSVAVANLRSSSGSLPSSRDHDPNQETQLLYGEPVKIISESGDWLKIEALEQQEFSHSGRWQGYPGWIKKNTVAHVRKIPPYNFIVKNKAARLYRTHRAETPVRTLSIGTKLVGKKAIRNGLRKVKTVREKSAWIRQEDLLPIQSNLSESRARETILRSASEFLGDPYFWGGRSSFLPELSDQVTSIDCSGLTNLSYRVAGIEVPRDSHEQYLKARKIKKGDLKPGDMIFTASKEKPEKVTHVALFKDNETLIEAPQTGWVVREIAFKDKYGISLKQLVEGEAVGSKIIYFGTYFH